MRTKRSAKRSAAHSDPAAAAELRARKAPTQNRSIEMVRRIIDATRRLLKQANEGELTRITTNHIAKEADISVGSLYQYFPNTESVLYELYQEMLDEVQGMLKEFDSRLSLPRDEFFEKLSYELASAGKDKEVVFAMRTAINLYPRLAAADKRHAEHATQRIAEYLKHYGSKWPPAKLQRLTMFTYYMDSGIWAYRDHFRPPNSEVIQWETDALSAAFQRCFD